MPQSLSIGYKELNRIFPFFILINKDVVIESHGASLSKLLGDCIGKNIEQIFSFERPHLDIIDFKNICTIQNELVILKTRNTDKHLFYRGQFELIEESNKLLLVGDAWFDSIEELNNSGLVLRDYAAHNPLVDLLHILKNQEIANAEMKELLDLINEQKNQIKQSKVALEESNNRYEYVNKATTDAIWDLDLVNGTMFHGEGFQRMFGFNPDSLNVNESYWNHFLHPEDVKKVAEELEIALNSNQTHWTGEFRYLRSDGSYANILDRAFIIRDHTGKATRMVGAMRDITKTKEREHHLKLLESVIKNSNEGIMITENSANNPIVFVNDAFTKITAYTLDEVFGKNPRIFYGPNTDKEEMRKIKQAMMHKKSCEIRTIQYRKTGEEFWISLFVTPIANDKNEYTHWIFIMRDITELMSYTEDLSNQKKFTEDILNNIPADIAVFDNQHKYLFVNPNAIKDAETRQWMIGKTDFDYAKSKNIDDKMARFRREAFNKTVESQKMLEWIDEHKSENKIRYVLRKFYPYFENRKLKFVIGYGIDITERKMIEIKLNDALEDIKKTNTELEQFAYVASHDLQEPLRMVTSFLTQLEKKYGDTFDSRAKEYIFYAVDGAKRMRQIILDLLEFSRVGRTEEKMTDVDTNDIVKEVVLLHSRQIEELKAEVNFDHLPTVRAIRSPVRQVLQNLIGNSLKYHKKEAPPRIFIQAEEIPGFWKFSITDNGIGIDPLFHEKIFTIFQRLHNRSEYEGTGIGLAITKKIVEMMGGKIWVTSVEQLGSTFCFTIPK